MEKSGIPSENAKRLYYRRGHWRGTSSVIYNDNTTKEFSYSKTICAYKNAYFFFINIYNAVSVLLQDFLKKLAKF